MVTALYNITWYAPHYYHVSIFKDGKYTGNGAFLYNWSEVIDYCKINEVTKIERSK